jgi:heptosyltransferase II
MGYPQKVLVIAPTWVGDMVSSQPLLQLIKKNNPNCSIDVLARSLLHPLINRMPEVDLCLMSPFVSKDLKIFKRFKLGRSIKRHGYTQAYILPNSFKSALVPFFAGIPVRTGSRGELRYLVLNDLRVLDKRKLFSQVERYMALGYQKDEPLPTLLPTPALEVSKENLKSTLVRLDLDLPEKPLLAICPGSERITKCWPASYYAKVASVKKNEGWDVWMFGAPTDQNIAKEIQELSHNSCVDLIGKTDLGEAVDLLSLATAVVTNDSGLMHIASALSKPIVAIYGPTSPKENPPRTKNKFKIISPDMPCSPCRVYNDDKCRVKYRCLYETHPDVVLEAIKEIV